MQPQRTIGPASALCATCGCSVRGQAVTTTLEYNAVLRCEVPTHRHATPGGCAAARAQSNMFWKDETNERAA